MKMNGYELYARLVEQYAFENQANSYKTITTHGYNSDKIQFYFCTPVSKGGLKLLEFGADSTHEFDDVCSNVKEYFEYHSVSL